MQSHLDGPAPVAGSADREPPQLAQMLFLLNPTWSTAASPGRRRGRLRPRAVGRSRWARAGGGGRTGRPSRGWRTRRLRRSATGQAGTMSVRSSLDFYSRRKRASTPTPDGSAPRARRLHRRQLSPGNHARPRQSRDQHAPPRLVRDPPHRRVSEAAITRTPIWLGRSSPGRRQAIAIAIANAAAASSMPRVTIDAGPPPRLFEMATSYCAAA